MRLRPVFWAAALLAAGIALLCRSSLQRRAAVSDAAVVRRGVVCSFPQRLNRPHGGESVRFDFQPQGGRCRLRVTAPRAVAIEYGDELELKGRMFPPSPARNPGGFDQAAYFRREEIDGNLLVADPSGMRRIARGRGHPVLRAAGSLRKHLEQDLDRVPPAQRAVAKAILLGDQSGISPRLRDDFAASGTAHLLAISGGNVALIAWLAVEALRALRLPARAARAGAIAVVVLHCLAVGCEASVLRATIMAVFFLLGNLIRRDSEVVTSLSWSAIFILSFQPLQVFDPGFQLSFLAVFMIAAGLGTAEESSAEDAAGFRVKKYVRVAFYAWIGTAPVIAAHFNLFAPFSVPANLVAVPYFEAVVAGGLAFVSLARLHPLLADVLESAFSTLIQGFMAQAGAWARAPGSCWRLPSPGGMEIAAFYVILFAWLFRRRIDLRTARWAIAALTAANLKLCTLLFSPPQKRLAVTFLDVGHGDAALIEFPGKGTFLIDAGAGGEHGPGRRALAPFLWSRGWARLDAMLITHPHFDHYGGLDYLLNEFEIGSVFDSGGAAPPPYAEALHRRGIGRVTVRAGWKIAGPGGTRLEILHPDAEGARSASANERSVVLRLDYGRVRILFAADAGSRALRRLQGSPAALAADALKVPHHGGDLRREGARFFADVRPKIAIISAGERNRFGLPSPATVSRLRALGAEVLETGRNGAIRVETDGETIRVTPMLR